MIGAVGSTIERLDSKRFVPVIFQIDHPRHFGAYQTGTPIDVAIADGVWYILYKQGILVTLNRQGQLIGILDPEDGIPPSAQRLIVSPDARDIFVGSTEEGVVVVGKRYSSR
jgi:hypothetical protein